MTTLYKYACDNDDCTGVYTWVEWLVNEYRPQTLPCCAECGSNEHMRACNALIESDECKADVKTPTVTKTRYKRDDGVQLGRSWDNVGSNDLD